MDKEVRKIILGTVYRMLWGGGVSLKRRVVERPSLPNTLISAAALLGSSVHTSSMLLSGPHLSLLFCLRTYLQVGPEVQESECSWSHHFNWWGKDTGNTDRKLRSTFYIHGSVELPQQHWALLLSGNQRTDSPVITFSSFPGSLFQLS